jgi:hypothetical protein
VTSLAITLFSTFSPTAAVSTVSLSPPMSASTWYPSEAPSTVRELPCSAATQRLQPVLDLLEASSRATPTWVVVAVDMAAAARSVAGTPLDCPQHTVHRGRPSQLVKACDARILFAWVLPHSFPISISQKGNMDMPKIRSMSKSLFDTVGIRRKWCISYDPVGLVSFLSCLPRYRTAGARLVGRNNR